MRVRSILSWLFFCVNVVCIATFVGSWLLAHDPAASTARRDAKAMGMDVYSVRNPFVILVDKESLGESKYRFFRYGSPVIVDAEPAEPNKRKVSIALATDFDMSCVYSFDSDRERVQVHELTLDVNNEHFVDLNADGRFDMRLNVDPRKSVDLPQSPEIWYRGRWHEVRRADGGGKYERQLLDGTSVIFDMNQGEWTLPGSKSLIRFGDGEEKGKEEKGDKSNY